MFKRLETIVYWGSLMGAGRGAKPTLISLFSGCGGLDLGFKNAGFEVVWANDIHAYAVETYRKNLGPEIVLKDIREVAADDIPQADVLVAGFPCQPFSSAGKRLGTADLRGSLFLECFRIIDAKKPKAVVFENVRGLKSIHNGALLEKILLMFRERGYSVFFDLVNASEYGVPQKRIRLIIVALKDGEYVFPEKLYGVDLSLGATIGNVDASLSNAVSLPLSPQIQKIIGFIPEGGSWKNIPESELPPRLLKIRRNMRKYRSPNFMRRFAMSEICGTITASATPENSGILHPVQNRRFTVREIARIQSFPDDFVFYGPLREQYRQIGNAVPPKLAQKIAENLKSALQASTEIRVAVRSTA